jgi:uncharacterized membrane protein
MEKKAKVLVYVPQEVYIEIHKRQLTNHISYLVSRLLEEFLRTGVRITWEEMPTRSKQREYLEAKLQEFFSRNGLPSEPPKPPVQERVETTQIPKPPVQERTEGRWAEMPAEPPTTLSYSAAKSEPVKEEPPPPPKEKGQDLDFDEEFLKKWESFW